MIIWLNGAFGAGKTQTAWELRRRPGENFYQQVADGLAALGKGDAESA